MYLIKEIRMCPNSESRHTYNSFVSNLGNKNSEMQHLEICVLQLSKKDTAITSKEKEYYDAYNKLVLIFSCHLKQRDSHIENGTMLQETSLSNILIL